MKFLCVDCDQRMEFTDRKQPGDGTFAAAFACPACGRRVAMLANPMESRLVESLGVEIGGRTLDPEPFETVRREMDGAATAMQPESGQVAPRWSDASVARLARVPSFVRGMVKRIYTDWAAERSIELITPEVMDRARVDLGLEDM